MKLKYKIIALNVSTLLIILVIIGTIILGLADNYRLQSELKYLQNQGEYAATYVEQYVSNRDLSVFDVPKFMEKKAAPYLAAYLKNTVNCNVQIFYNNAIIGDSDDTPNIDSDMMKVVSKINEKTYAYFISKKPNRILYYAAPIILYNKYTYVIGFKYELKEADATRGFFRQILVFISLLSVLVIILISPIISNRITHPVKELSAATKQFSKGDFEIRSHTKSHDEVGELSKTFNTMADNIQDMINKLHYEKEKQKYFFDNFTHEIRTPLTTILGYTELLWKTDNEEVRDKSLYHITSEGKRMLNMVERLLELSKLKNYNYELNKSQTNLKDLIENVCDSMHYKAKRYNVSFNLDLEDISYSVDPELFRQVVINIVDNSLKYSKSPNIDITLKNTDRIELTITDYGCGIDPTNLENIFEPYYKIDKSRNSSVEGWGLGLSIVKEIITKHDGTIEINSYPNRGTKVKIVI